MADLGDAIPLGIVVREPAGPPVNATDVDLTITLPDGTMVTPMVANPPAVTGEYIYDYMPPMEGRYLVRWVVTGPNAALVDSFDVRNPAKNSLISLADAKAHINMSQARTTDDEEIIAMVEAATAVVERHRHEVIARRVVTEFEPSGRRGRVALLHHPVIKVISAMDYSGTAIPVEGLMVDGETGIVAGPGISKATVITYEAGYVSVPANYILAAKIIFAHLWQTQRVQSVGAQPTLGGQSRREEQIVTPSGTGYAIPHRALELLGTPPSLVV